MDPQYSAQDVLRCDNCEATEVSKFCKICHLKLCRDCAGKSCQRTSQPHQVLSYQERHSITVSPPCAKHAGKHCELKCITCDIPVCSTCIYSKEHGGHRFTSSDISREGNNGVREKQVLKKSDTEKAHQPIHNLSKLSNSKQGGEHGISEETSHGASAFSPLVKPLLEKPRLLYTLRTDIAGLSNIACSSDDEIWACGWEKTIIKHSMRSRQMSSLETKCKNSPCDLTVTKNGHLVFTDVDERTVNIVKKKNKIEKLVKLKKWLPRYVCSTLEGDLLVMMDHADYNSEPTRVIRYTGSTEKQIIYSDDQGRPLYSTGGYSRYIAENGNMDICVSDNGYGFERVTVVSQTGKFRFQYKGNPVMDEKRFIPRGIATDSQNRILVVCVNNACIHIMDQDGQFLQYIKDCDFCDLNGLCVDNKDNVFVTEYRTTKVKKIQYVDS